MSDQNPARDYDKESLKFFIQRAQMGSYSPLTLQEIKAELKRRDEQTTMEKREHWNGHVYIVRGDNSTLQHDPDCPCQRQPKKQQDDTMVLGKLLDNMFECWT
jgi:sensor histidine kinase regulating citrate/malate metabolism